jgi:hypothetical protein
MGRKKAKQPSKPNHSAAQRLRFTPDELMDSTNHEDVQIELGHQSTVLKQVLNRIPQQRQQLNDIQQRQSRREKLQLDILKNQKKLARPLNNRDVSSFH